MRGRGRTCLAEAESKMRASHLPLRSCQRTPLYLDDPLNHGTTSAAYPPSLPCAYSFCRRCVTTVCGVWMPPSHCDIGATGAHTSTDLSSHHKHWPCIARR